MPAKRFALRVTGRAGTNCRDGFRADDRHSPRLFYGVSLWALLFGAHASPPTPEAMIRILPDASSGGILHANDFLRQTGAADSSLRENLRFRDSRNRLLSFHFCQHL